MIQSSLFALAGGVLIGVAVTLMLLFNGRVTGISGIIGHALRLPKTDLSWRVAFFMGLLAGGVILRFAAPEVFVNTSDRSLATVAIAGFLVGFGTLLGGGCTSGHGVCGISRFSLRSILATITFIAFGILSVWALKVMGVAA